MEQFEGIAQSIPMRQILKAAKRIATIPRAVLIRGERGTGKELLARFIHNRSQRQAKQFHTVNCASFTDELLNAEIFGYEKGAFTGADNAKPGRLELCDKSTLFLDEIGSMSSAFQDRILRVIEYQSFERIGGTKTISVDVRIISATNAPLEDMIENGLFRADLYDRLTFVEINLPPLRQRREDIPHLVVHFVQKLQLEIPNLPHRNFMKETIEAMMDYYWPGNIRELKNIVERVYVFGDEETIKPSDLPPGITGWEDSGLSFCEKVDNYKKRLVLEAYKQCNCNQRLAAKELQMTYDQFRHYYKKFSE